MKSAVLKQWFESLALSQSNVTTHLTQVDSATVVLILWLIRQPMSPLSFISVGTGPPDQRTDHEICSVKTVLFVSLADIVSPMSPLTSNIPGTYCLSGSTLSQ